MDFLGKNIDDQTIEKLKGILNSPEGEKLRQELSKLDAKELLNKLNGVDFSNINMKNVADKINNTDKNIIIEQLGKVNNKFIKNRR